MAFKYSKNEKDNSLLVEDPIYGQVIVPYPFSRLVLTPEMLRLGDISQNGFSQYEFVGLADNDRLSHSVGAFHVMTLILERLESILANYNIKIDQDDKDMALCSMLLHDIGHGPFSHSLELITNYSHEKRTTDILLGDTEINKILVELFGKSKVKQIASFIAEINDQEEIGKDSFTKLLHSLVSHQLDADRIDYLARDAYYAKMPSTVNLHRIIENLSIIVNNNQEYELLILRNGLSSIENVLIQRYQMYREVYLSPIAMLGNNIFKRTLERFRKNEKLLTCDVSDQFKSLAYDFKITSLEEFLKMSDSDFKRSFDVLKDNPHDPVVAYLANKDNLKDYIMIENSVTPEKIKRYLKELFGALDFSDTLSITTVTTKSKMYKREQGLKIQLGNKVADLTECTELIRPQEILENTYVFFNPELLRLELGLSKEEFRKYEDDISRMIDELNKKPEEFELKYSIEGGTLFPSLGAILDLFTRNGFDVVSTTKKQNCDEYFDSSNLDLFQKGGSLRIRKVDKNNKTKFKGTFKMPLGEGEVYSSRTEIEESLPSVEYEVFVEKMKEAGVPIDFSTIKSYPVLNSTTDRIDIILEKNGIQVCLSIDNTVYTNHILDECQAKDAMMEIEAVGELNNRIILNEIDDMISQFFTNLVIMKQSKYERGTKKTMIKYYEMHPELNADLVRKKLPDENQ